MDNEKKDTRRPTKLPVTLIIARIFACVNLLPAVKLPYITPQLHPDSLKNKDVIPVAPCSPRQVVLTAGEPSHCLCMVNSDAEDELQRHGVSSSLFFSQRFLGSDARLHTAAGCCLGESPQPSFF